MVMQVSQTFLNQVEALGWVKTVRASCVRLYGWVFVSCSVGTENPRKGMTSVEETLCV